MYIRVKVAGHSDISLITSFYNCRCAVYISGIHNRMSRKPDTVEAVKGDATITQLVWHNQLVRLYVGDSGGTIHVCSIHTSKVCMRFLPCGLVGAWVYSKDAQHSLGLKSIAAHN